MPVYTFIDKAGKALTAKTVENPKRAAHVLASFFRNGKITNRCIVPSRWLLSEYEPEKTALDNVSDCGTIHPAATGGREH